MEEIYGKDMAEMAGAAGPSEICRRPLTDPKTVPRATARSIATSRASDPDEYGLAIVPTTRGPNFLHVLESHFGRARFDAFLRGYFDAHASRA